MTSDTNKHLRLKKYNNNNLGKLITLCRPLFIDLLENEAEMSCLHGLLLV